MLLFGFYFFHIVLAIDIFQPVPWVRQYSTSLIVTSLNQKLKEVFSNIYFSLINMVRGTELAGVLLIVTLWFQNCDAYYKRRGVANNALQLSGLDSGNRYYQSDEAFLLDMMGKDAFEEALNSYLSSGNSAHDSHPKTPKIQKRSKQISSSEDSADFWKDYRTM